MQDRLSCHFSLARGLDFQAAEARLINESRTATGNTVAGIMIHMAGIGANHVEHPVSPHGRRPAEAPPSVNRCHDDYGREHRQQPKQSSPRTTRIPGISRSLPPHPGRGPPVTTRHLSPLSKRASVPPHPPPSDRRSRQNQHHPFPSPSPLDPRHPLSRCAVDVRRPRRGRVLMDRCPARGSTKCVRRPRGRGHGGQQQNSPCAIAVRHESGHFVGGGGGDTDACGHTQTTGCTMGREACGARGGARSDKFGDGLHGRISRHRVWVQGRVFLWWPVG
jgi:hypothetical protein